MLRVSSKMFCLVALAAGLGLVGCGDEGGDEHEHPMTPDAAKVDAPKVDVDAPTDLPTDVEEVDCGGATIAQTFTTSGLTFSPASASVVTGAIVRFTPANSSHNVVSGENCSSDNQFTVGFGGDKCFKFTKAGSYPFFCQPHCGMGMTATLSVTP